jgi:hypothetical protein
VSNHIHTKPARNVDHAEPDVTGTDYTYHSIAQLEAAQPDLREAPAPRPLYGVHEVARDRQQQGENMLGDG